jgi:hypothetical protein
MCIECTQDSSILNNTDLIFHDSYRLKIKPYSYQGEEDKRYSCQGDTIYYTTLPDTFDTKPLIQWDSVKFSIITAAIFTSPVVVKDNIISNTNDIIWNSGMEFEKSSSIKYIEGKNVSNSIINYESVPDPLLSGLYYWAVWGWNSEGTKILYSSRQMSFYVQ